MEFLMTDGSWKYLPEASSAEVEHGILVCRNAAGDIVRTFARSEVLAFGDRLKLTDEPDRRNGGRQAGARARTDSCLGHLGVRTSLHQAETGARSTTFV